MSLPAQQEAARALILMIGELRPGQFRNGEALDRLQGFAGELTTWLSEPARAVNGERTINAAFWMDQSAHTEPLIELLLAAPNHVGWSKEERAQSIRNALSTQCFNIIPSLWRGGFEFNNITKGDVWGLNKAIGKGYWPMPELLYPDLLRGEFASDCFRALYLGEGFMPDQKNMTPEMVNRLSSLATSENTREQATTKLIDVAEKPNDTDWKWQAFYSQPLKVEALARMLELEWLDVGRIQQQTQSLGHGKELEVLLAQAEFLMLSGRTGKANGAPRIARL